MSEHVSRRRFLQGASLGAIGGVSGCLRLTESTADTPASGSTDAPDTGTAPDAGTAAQSETPSSSSFSARESWTLDKFGSDIVTYDGTFYLSTWVSKQLLAVQPDGTIEWETDQLGKFKRDSLSVTESTIFGCGYGGQLTAVERSSGTPLWNFTGGRYDSWTTKPLVTDQYVICANRGDTPETDDDYVVYVLDRGSGEVVDTIEYAGLRSPIESIGRVGGNFYVGTFNFLDLYALDSRSEVASYDKHLYGTGYVRDGDLFVATSSNVYRYRLTGSEHELIWGTTLRGSVSDLRFTSDGILANGEAGIFNVGYDGEQRWWGEMDAYTDRPAVVDNYVFALDKYHQLRMFDFDSGDRLDETTLPPEGLPLAPLASIDRSLLVGLEPLIAYDVP
jgi:outer membrane protein assembly factor BamB